MQLDPGEGVFTHASLMACYNWDPDARRWSEVFNSRFDASPPRNKSITEARPQRSPVILVFSLDVSKVRVANNGSICDVQLELETQGLV